MDRLTAQFYHGTLKWPAVSNISFAMNWWACPFISKFWHLTEFAAWAKNDLSVQKSQWTVGGLIGDPAGGKLPANLIKMQAALSESELAIYFCSSQLGRWLLPTELVGLMASKWIWTCLLWSSFCNLIWNKIEASEIPSWTSWSKALQCDQWLMESFRFSDHHPKSSNRFIGDVRFECPTWMTMMQRRCTSDESL